VLPGGFPRHRGEDAEDVPVCVHNQCQSIRVPIAAFVKGTNTETIAAATPKKSKLMFLEIFKNHWKTPESS
jgi:hypothetical protein